MIGIFNSLFIIIFTAHILGCAFSMLADAEPDNNWMLHYEPALLGATNDVRYIASIYWAMIRSLGARVILALEGSCHLLGHDKVAWW